MAGPEFHVEPRSVGTWSRRPAPGTGKPGGRSTWNDRQPCAGVAKGSRPVFHVEHSRSFRAAFALRKLRLTSNTGNAAHLVNQAPILVARLNPRSLAG